MLTQNFDTHKVLGFISICVEEKSSNSVLKNCVGVIGDLITSYKQELAGYISQAPWLRELMLFCQNNDKDSQDVGRYLERALNDYSVAVR